MAVLLETILATPQIMQLVSEIAVGNTPMANFYGLSRGNSPKVKSMSAANTIAWDVLDNVRTLPYSFGSKDGPAPGQQQTVNTAVATLAHFGEQHAFLYDDFQQFRNLGGPFGSIDRDGVKYIAAQLELVQQKMDNLREFMVSRMFYGSFGLKRSSTNGRYFWPCDISDTPDVTIDYGLPAAHKSQLNVFGDGDLITTTWSTAGTDVAAQLRNVYAAGAKRFGSPWNHCWINTKTLNYLFKNTSMQYSQPTGFTTYKSFTKEQQSLEGQKGMYDVVFNACPLMTFHVCDFTHTVLAESNAFTSAGGMRMVVPDDRVIFTPDPSSSWVSFGVGGRTIQPTVADAYGFRYGLTSYSMPIVGAGPAGKTVVIEDCFLPLPFSRYAWCYGTVG
jgi:hypothetical protein